MRGDLMFMPMSDYPIEEEGCPFLVLRHGNDMHSFLVQQVQNFEGGIYPDEFNAAVDYSDAVMDAVGWCEMPRVTEPLTIEGTHQETSE